MLPLVRFVVVIVYIINSPSGHVGLFAVTVYVISWESSPLPSSPVPPSVTLGSVGRVSVGASSIGSNGFTGSGRYGSYGSFNSFSMIVPLPIFLM